MSLNQSAPPATPEAAAPTVPSVASKRITHERGRLGRTARAIIRAPLAVGGSIAILTLTAVLVLLGPAVAPYRVDEIAGAPFSPWGTLGWLTNRGLTILWLGSDWQGRDVLSRLLHGAPLTFLPALAVTVLAGIAGGLLGLLVGASRSWLGDAVARAADVLAALPPLVFALLTVAVFDRSLPAIITVMTLAETAAVFGIARTLAAGIAAQEHVEAARLRGETSAWIRHREILPGLAVPLLRALGHRYASVLLTLSALGFVLRGLSPPAADWGGIARESAGMLLSGSLTPLVPAAGIFMAVLAASVVADGFRKRQPAGTRR